MTVDESTHAIRSKHGEYMAVADYQDYDSPNGWDPPSTDTRSS